MSVDAHVVTLADCHPSDPSDRQDRSVAGVTQVTISQRHYMYVHTHGERASVIYAACKKKRLVFGTCHETGFQKSRSVWMDPQSILYSREIYIPEFQADSSEDYPWKKKMTSSWGTVIRRDETRALRMSTMLQLTPSMRIWSRKIEKRTQVTRLCPKQHVSSSLSPTDRTHITIDSSIRGARVPHDNGQTGGRHEAPPSSDGNRRAPETDRRTSGAVALPPQRSSLPP